MAVKYMITNYEDTILEMVQTTKAEEIYYDSMEKEIAALVILEYLDLCKKYKIPHHLELKYVDELTYNLKMYGVKRHLVETFLYQYFKLKEKKQQKLLETVMKKHNFNYAPSIRNAIYNLLSNPIDWRYCSCEPQLWPGIKEIQRDDNFYVLDTKLGRIQVSKATPKFLETASGYIFKKPLIHKCFYRTYEFVKENRDSYAILSKQPNHFYGYDYHAYVEQGDEIIDIAANAFYHDKENAKKVLVGEELAKLTYEEIEDELNSMDLSELKGKEKLYILSAYHDIKNRNSIH